MTSPATATNRLARVFLAVAATMIAVAVLLGMGWYRAATRPPALDSIGDEERHRLVGELIERSPGVFIDAYFEPRIGFVLRPQSELAAWGTTFRSNSLGFRAGGVNKPARLLRVACVGDSWTFGMGVDADQAYPARLAGLAAEAGVTAPVEGWNLALPGYNTFNEVAALEYFLDRLRPDVVVLAPTMNDVDSGATVLPNGSLATPVGVRDAFGDAHPHAYRVRLFDSYVYLRRWRQAMGEIRRLESRLQARGIPLVLFFTGRWRDPFVHRLVGEAGIDAAYTILPLQLTQDRWLLPDYGHPTPDAYRLHAEIVYRLLAETSGWPRRPADPAAPPIVVHRAPPPGDWERSTREAFAEMSRAQLAEELVPPATPLGCLGGLDCRSGLLSRGGTALLRRRAGATRLEILLRPLASSPGAYPMRVDVEIPSAAGGTHARVTLAARAGADVRLELPLPPDLPAGSAMDVVLHAERAVAARHDLLGRSAWVIAVRQR